MNLTEFSIEQLSEIRYQGNTQVVDVKWRPAWINSSELPSHTGDIRSEVKVLYKSKSKTLIQWQATTESVKTLLRDYYSVLTIDQLNYLSPDIQHALLPWQSSQKAYINSRVRNLTIEAGRNALCVYLDADKAQTTSFLKCLDAKCVIVNDDSKVISNMLNEAHTRNVCIYTGTMYAYLTMMAQDASIDMFWGDYCTSFYNSTYNPCRDIRALKAKLSPTCRVAFTFSLRAGTRKHKSQLFEITSYIENTLCLRRVYYLIYNRNMCYLEFMPKSIHRYNLRSSRNLSRSA